MVTTIYTIGHSNHPIQRFIRLLKQHGIDVVVDTRSNPYSRYAEQFNRVPLQTSLEDEGLVYKFMGNSVGGRPREPEFYDAEGHVLYSVVSETAMFKSAIVELLAMAESHRIALVCGEEDPAHCHRKLMIARSLHEMDATTIHIRGDGSLVEDKLPPPPSQMLLFEEPLPWRSVKPVNS